MKRPRSLTQAIALDHLKKYSQYSGTLEWIRWYSQVAPLKGKRVAQTILKYKDRESRVLDLGCGIGLTLVALARTFPNSFGCDIGEREISATRALLDRLNMRVPVVLYDGKHLPFTDHNFDVVTSIEVIEHVKNPDTMLKEIKRILKPDGILHITTANKLWPIEPHYKLPFLSYLPKWLANFYLRLSKRGKSYEDINLPTYGEFYLIVNKYFDIEDITLDIIADYKKYGFDKERGIKVTIVGEIFKKLRLLKKIFPFNIVVRFIEFILLRVSLGWLFIAHVRK